jgi:hypothetical protein
MTASPSMPTHPEIASPLNLVGYRAHPHGAVAARWNAPWQLPSTPSWSWHRGS